MFGRNDLTIHGLLHVRSSRLFPLTSLLVCLFYVVPLANPHLMTIGICFVTMCSMLMNSGMRRQQFRGVNRVVVIGLVMGVVLVLFGPVGVGNSGTCDSLLHARLVTPCGLLVMCNRPLLRMIIMWLLPASRMLNLTLNLVL